MIKNFGNSWAKEANDRLNWKGLVSAHTQKWAAKTEA